MQHVSHALTYDTAADKATLIHTDRFHLAKSAPLHTKVYITNNDRLFMTIVGVNADGHEAFEAFLSNDRDEVIDFLDAVEVTPQVYAQAKIEFEEA